MYNNIQYNNLHIRNVKNAFKRTIFYVREEGLICIQPFTAHYSLIDMSLKNSE